MRIKRETDHATKCVLYLSRKPEEYINVAEISQKNDIPRPFLAKILQKLSKAGIVDSHQGNQGGFRLNKAPADISLKDVFEAIQGPLEVNKCVIDNHFCERINICSIHPIWIDIQLDINQKLAQTDFLTLQQKEEEVRNSIRSKLD